MQADDIGALEERIALRRHRIESTARLAKHRVASKVLSPAGLATAGAIGFLALYSLVRRPKKVYVHSSGARASRIAGVSSLLGSAAFALLRAQFGSPTQMAQVVLARLKKMQHQHPGGMERRAAAPGPSRP